MFCSRICKLLKNRDGDNQSVSELVYIAHPEIPTIRIQEPPPAMKASDLGLHDARVFACRFAQ